MVAKEGHGPDGEPVLDLVGAEWQTILWPRLTGSGPAQQHRQQILDEVLRHDARGRLTAAILAVGARAVLDQLSTAAVWPDELASVLDVLASAGDADLDRWAADFGALGT